MIVKADSWNGQPANGVPTTCPNLREKKVGFMKYQNYCSCSQQTLDYQYVNNVCKKCVYSSKTGSCDLKYMDCNQYRLYGIRN